MSKKKNIEALVLDALRTNIRARKDDFILYGSVLKRMGIDLGISLYTFLSTAREFYNAPSFESVTRCRRHIQEQMPELKDKETAEARQNEQYEFYKYSKTSVGGV